MSLCLTLVLDITLWGFRFLVTYIYFFKDKVYDIDCIDCEEINIAIIRLKLLIWFEITTKCSFFYFTPQDWICEAYLGSNEQKGDHSKLERLLWRDGYCKNVGKLLWLSGRASKGIATDFCIIFLNFFINFQYFNLSSISPKTLRILKNFSVKF